MKKIFFIAMVISITFIFGGCAKVQPNPVPDTKEQKGYETVTETQLPTNVSMWMKGKETSEGAYVYQHPEYTYVMIASGQKPTGGYGINIKSYSAGQYEKELVVEFTSPKKGEQVIQAITYPKIILKINSEYISRYTVKTVSGQEVKVEDKVIYGAIEKPQKNEVISSPVIVKGKIAAFEGSFVVRILDENKKEIAKEVLQTEGAPKWGPFEKGIEFKKPQTLKGTIEIGEYSAKDGEYMLRDSVEVKF